MISKSLLADAFIVLSCSSAGSKLVAGFSRASITSTVHKVKHLSYCDRMVVCMTSSNNDKIADNDSWDSEEDYQEFNASIDGPPPESDVDWNFLGPDGKLGIDIGKDLMNLTPEEAADLKREGAEVIERAFASKFQEIEKLQQTLQKDFEDSKKSMLDASDLRASLETDRLMNKIDELTNNFLKKSEQSRVSTKLAAAADQNMAGRGLEFGSWGTDTSGREVVTLGEKGSSFYIEETLGDNLPGSNTANKILVIVDESKSKEDAKLAAHLVALFDEVSNTYCETVTPFRVPTGGGENCKVALIFSSCISDRSDFESLLDRLLKRTVSTFPPTDLVLVSSLGTERTNKMPYSMQNLLGGKLDKKREIEEAIVSRSRMGLFGGVKPLDYTVVKFGELKQSNLGSKNKGEPQEASHKVDVAFGDALDGSIEFDDAAQVLFQSIVLQKPARNCTFSAVADGVAGTTETPMSQDAWDDIFIRLDGPELYRIEINKAGVVDSNYKLLCEYLYGWAKLFEEEDGKKMGLSTPVTVTKSESTPWSVKIDFKATRTGASYKSSKEEKDLEMERKKYIKPSNDQKKSSDEEGEEKKPMKKDAKEGGVEVLVELEPVLRVRAKRCNMGYETIVKEMSEEIILKKLRDAIKFWLEKEIKPL